LRFDLRPFVTRELNSAIDARTNVPVVWNRNHNIKGNSVAVKSIQLGQVWRNDKDGQDYLVTKLYSEVFSQFAVLRPALVTAPDAPTVRVKVAKAADGASLPGYTFTQEGSF
jgi:hypothetical protein